MGDEEWRCVQKDKHMAEAIDFLKILVPASVPGVIAILIWLGDRRNDRKWEQYKRKEDRYIALVGSLKGFYTSTDPEIARKHKEEFIQQLNVCWLYCPDAIIEAGYYFLDQVSTGASKSNEEKDRALGQFIVLMRKDLIGNRMWFVKRTRLDESDFRILIST